MNLRTSLSRAFALLAFGFAPFSAAAADRGDAPPNVLLLLTDDHYLGSVSAYDEHPNADTPNLDRLAEEGVLFTRAIIQAPQCVTARRSILTGQYPHRNGVYTFERSHWETDFFRPGFPEMLRYEKDYSYNFIGKTHTNFVRGWRLRGDRMPPYLAALNVRTPQFFIPDIWDNFYKERPGMDDPFYVYEEVDGKRTITNNWFPPREVDEQYDIVRSYRRLREPLRELIYAGHSPRPAGETITDYITRDFQAALERIEADGRPFFARLGYKFPHSPIMPPKEWSDRFEAMDWDIPEFTEEELDFLLSMPQMKEFYVSNRSHGMTDDEIRDMISDHFAMVAYGDRQIGRAVDAFKALSEKQGRPWLIIYSADSGAHLHHHGTIDKFSLYDVTIRVPFIIASSDKAAFPPGTVYDGLIEQVDIAPTILEFCGIDTDTPRYDYLDGRDLAKVIHGELPRLDEALVETGHLYGHRAGLRTERYNFYMRTRPRDFTIGENYDWAANAEPEELEMTLFDLENDPRERKNLAYLPEYQALAGKFRERLQERVLGDDRIEYEWHLDTGGETPKGISVDRSVSHLYDWKTDSPEYIRQLQEKRRAAE